MAMSQFVNPAAHDWRPTFGAAAIDAGNPNDFPPSDRAGLLRNGPPDAGAHEYNGISPSGDTQPPSVPAGLLATAGVEQVALTWLAASDNLGVVRYHVHRSTVAGFTPSTGNRVAQPTGASYTDANLAPGTYFYVVVAEDAAGNVSTASAQASATVSPPADTTPPSAPGTPCRRCTACRSASRTSTSPRGCARASARRCSPTSCRPCRTRSS
jgi:hypothetical protein